MSIQHALLLLPPIPEPATYPSIKAAYHVSLLLVLRKLKESTPGRSILDIALPCPHLWSSTELLRSTTYQASQVAIANLYKLVCIIAAKQGIEVADVDGDSIDIRIILVAYPRDGKLKTGRSGITGNLLGPVVELDVLARSGRPWARIFSVETEQGETVLKNFKTLAEGKDYQYEKIRGGIVQVTKAHNASDLVQHRCSSVAVGGTFDHLHIGHKLLLTMTLFALDTPTDGDQGKTKVVTIGMTAADLLAKKQYAEMLQSWKLRTERTHAFIQGISNFSTEGDQIEKSEEVHKPGPNGHALIIRLPWASSTLELRYVEIWDPFGPTITDPEIDTIVVSGETRSGGKMVNDKRVEFGMNELEVFEVDVLDTDEEDKSHGSTLENTFQAKLSSTEIRKAQAERLKGKSKV
jgi:phosphopantetheine adenylyltransferase